MPIFKEYLKILISHSKYYKKYKMQTIFLGFIFFFYTILTYPIPYLTKLLIDEAIIKRNIELFYHLIIGIFIIQVLLSLIGYFQSYLSALLNNKLLHEVRIDIIDKINRISLQIFEKYNEGYLHSRFYQDTEYLSSCFIQLTFMIFKNILTFIIGLILCLSINVKLTILITIMSFINYYINSYFGVFLKKYRATTLEQFAKLSEKALLIIKMKKISTIFRNYTKSKEIYHNTFTNLYNSLKIIFRYIFISEETTSFNRALTNIFLLLIGGYLIIKGQLTVGALIALQSYSLFISSSIAFINNAKQSLYMAIPAYKRICEIYNMEEDCKNSTVLINIDHIELDINKFSYNDDNVVLLDTKIDINKGDRIAIIGESGCGKTSLLRLLLGFYQFNGKIKVNETEYDDIQSIIREKSSFVEQDPFLFEGTVEENVIFSHEENNQERLIQVLKKAHAYFFVSKLPLKTKSIIQNSELQLSKGQAQRITIARALYKNPEFLLMDEPTASIDNKSQSYIIETIKNLEKDVTVIIVTHRKELLKICNKIIEIKEKKCYTYDNKKYFNKEY